MTTFDFGVEFDVDNTCASSSFEENFGRRYQ